MSTSKAKWIQLEEVMLSKLCQILIEKWHIYFPLCEIKCRKKKEKNCYVCAAN